MEEDEREDRKKKMYFYGLKKTVLTEAPCHQMVILINTDHSSVSPLHVSLRSRISLKKSDDFSSPRTAVH
jgi:hypothetical protein